jgi:anti-sigma regulatory factor (Ser/Thr protein kinase)/DNA-binding transcriptional ArsR family regulator
MMYANRATPGPEDDRVDARVAVYPASGDPEISEVSAASTGAAAAKLTRLVMGKVKELGGRVPEEAVSEVVENLVHAGYEGVVISVLAGGDLVRVSDKGPGIEHKEQAFEFGFSGASPEVLGGIRGIGAGLGMARAAVERVGGTISLEDNIGGGTVVTISVEGGHVASGDDKGQPQGSAPKKRYPGAVPKMNISGRQEKVLVTVLESGEVGPSTVADRLEMSVSTAYRDLSQLEEQGLVAAAESGKRVITPLGRDVVEAIVADWLK